MDRDNVMKRAEYGFSRLRIVMVAMGLAMLTLAPQLFPQNKEPEPKPSSASQELRFRGHIVCLAEEMNRLHQAQIPTPHEHLYGFKTTNGTFYTLLRTRTSEALFSDKRLQQMELIVQGRVLPNTQLLDAIPIGSVHEGKLYDLYYWCTVCAIRTPIPGTCMCCQEPVEFVEKPIEK